MRKERRVVMFSPMDIAEFLQQKPFEPFRIHVTDGASYDILHPEFVLISPTRVWIMVPWKQKPTLPFFERTDSVALMHVSRLEKLAPQASGKQNGPDGSG